MSKDTMIGIILIGLAVFAIGVYIGGAVVTVLSRTVATENGVGYYDQTTGNFTFGVVPEVENIEHHRSDD